MAVGWCPVSTVSPFLRRPPPRIEISRIRFKGCWVCETSSQPVHRRPSDLDRLEEMKRVGKGAVVQEISAMFELQAGKLSVVCLGRKDGRAWLSNS